MIRRSFLIAGALATVARTKKERVGPGGSNSAESDLAIGYDQDPGRAGSRLGVAGRDRLASARVQLRSTDGCVNYRELICLGSYI
jgi:hypothetical protein